MKGRIPESFGQKARPHSMLTVSEPYLNPTRTVCSDPCAHLRHPGLWGHVATISAHRPYNGLCGQVWLIAEICLYLTQCGSKTCGVLVSYLFLQVPLSCLATLLFLKKEGIFRRARCVMPHALNALISACCI